MASVQLPEHFKPLSASLTLMRCCLDPKRWSRTKFFSTYTFGAPNLPPRNGPNRRFSKGPCSRRREKSDRLDWMRCAFFFIFPDFAKFQYGNFTNMDFSQKCQMQRHAFVIPNRFYAVFCIQGCLHWLSSPIRSVVMADQSLTAII